MINSRESGISQSALENPGPYIPIRTAHTDCQYGPPHTDCLIRTASYGPTFHHNKITRAIYRVYGLNVFIDNKAVKKRRKM